MINSGYPYEGFSDMFPETEPTPDWIGFGHKHLVYNQTPVKHYVLVDGQQRSEISVEDPDEPLDHVVADQLRGQPAERAPWPISNILSINPTARPNARFGLETGQFERPDTRPAVIMHHRKGRR